MIEVKASVPKSAVPMREFTVADGVMVKIQEADVQVFLAWIQEGHRPVWFLCSNCGYAATAKLEASDVAHASTGGSGAWLECAKCRAEFKLEIPKNGHELTQQVLER